MVSPRLRPSWRGGRSRRGCCESRHVAAPRLVDAQGDNILRIGCIRFTRSARVWVTKLASIARGGAGGCAWAGDFVDRMPALAALLCLVVPQIAFAHTGVGGLSGFMSGVAHPLFGPDHLVAMLAVGLWGSQLGNPALWVLPVTFPLIMAVGGVPGRAGHRAAAGRDGDRAIGAGAGRHGRPFRASAAVGCRPDGRRLRPVPRQRARARAAGGRRSAGLCGGLRAGDRLHPPHRHSLGLLGRWPAGAQAVRAGGALVAVVGVWFLLPGGA